MTLWIKKIWTFHDTNTVSPRIRSNIQKHFFNMPIKVYLTLSHYYIGLNHVTLVRSFISLTVHFVNICLIV